MKPTTATSGMKASTRAVTATSGATQRGDRSPTDGTVGAAAAGAAGKPSSSSSQAAASSRGPSGAGNNGLGGAAGRHPSAAQSSNASFSSDDITEPSESGRNPEGNRVITVNGRAYTKLEVIGRGGSSKVFRVVAAPVQGSDEDGSSASGGGPVAGETFALKRVVTHNRTQFALFQNEVSLLESLRGKPNIIQIRDSEVIRNEKLLVLMEYGDTDFNKFLHSEPDLDMADIRKFWVIRSGARARVSLFYRNTHGVQWSLRAAVFSFKLIMDQDFWLTESSHETPGANAGGSAGSARSAHRAL